MNSEGVQNHQIPIGNCQIKYGCLRYLRHRPIDETELSNNGFRIHMNTLHTNKRMAYFKTKQNRFSMSYKSGESEMYEKIENELMKELNICTRSDLHKFCIRHLYSTRKKSSLQLV